MRRPPNIEFLVPTLFGGQFEGKYCSLCTYNPPAKEVGWLDGFLYEAVPNFELLSKFSRSK
jgi:hypothetical protein